jgi:hypothetical protein
MNTTLLPVVVAAGALCLASPGPLPAQSQSEIAEMMAKAGKFTKPGEQHQVLARFLGEWNTETRMFMGAQAGAAEAGKASFRWRMEGRWLESEWSGPMMGMPVQGAMWLGYDNFKMSFVATTVTNVDTAMNRSEGDLTQDGKTLLLYGTLDEYLTGEHDKLVKYVWRFLSEDKLVFEVHDLPIGETNTKVVEVTYTRAK